MKTTIVGLFLFMYATTVFSQTKADAILGEWLSSKKNSRVFIYKQGIKFYGRITWGTGSATKDEKNPKPELRTRDLIGMVILTDFEFDGNETWKDGSIYDPREGKTYACKMTLQGADKLRIRGYVGIPLFGRSEVWTKYQ